MTWFKRKRRESSAQRDSSAETLLTSSGHGDVSSVEDEAEILFAISGHGAAHLFARANVDSGTIQSKIVSIAERIQVGDQKEGAEAIRELIEIATSQSSSNITQSVAELDARQGVYLSASGTLVQFNAIMAGMLGAAMSLSFPIPLRIILAAPLLMHTMAALLLCWSARPVTRSINTTAAKFLSSQQNDVDDTFRNYRRGWRMTMVAVFLSVFAASSYVLNVLGVDLSQASQTLRDVTK